MRAWGLIGLAILSAVPAVPAVAASTWTPSVAAGYDGFLHNYHLAVDDTTEFVSEFQVVAGLEGRASRRARHRWHLRTELAAGTELFRELIEADYRFRPEAGEERLRFDVRWLGRQYRQDSDYVLSSDNHEGRGEVRVTPWIGRRTTFDLGFIGRFLDYRAPSTLELDQREAQVAAFLRSRTTADGIWSFGGRVTSRVYPDSTAIDRDSGAIEASWDRVGPTGLQWLFHRSERRLIADETARPSAWSHWSEVRAAFLAGPGRVVTNLTSEVWKYDTETGAWFDSWRLGGEAGYRWGDLLSTVWQALLTGELLDAGDQPEAYTQLGVRGGVESYAGTVSGAFYLELGRRWYAQGLPEDTVLTYSDFSYLAIWLMGSLHFTREFSLDLIANYQPESHTEQDDDVALGFATVRLVWRR